MSAAVSDLVRGCLCPAIKSVFDHGLLRKSPLLSGPVHPWVFIEEAASKEVKGNVVVYNFQRHTYKLSNMV